MNQGNFIVIVDVPAPQKITNFDVRPQSVTSTKIDPLKNELDVRTLTNINILEADKEHVVFDIQGIDVSVANRFRQAMIAEIPTMAIEYVAVSQNTSVIQDEVLAHRLAFVPIKVNPNKFKSFDNLEDDYNPNDSERVIKFRLFVQCNIVNGRIVNSDVFSGSLIWQPLPGQDKMFLDKDYPRPVYNDILLAKLKPGQVIDLECYCVKGIGNEHLKWSPVTIASYVIVKENEPLYNQIINNNNRFNFEQIKDIEPFREYTDPNIYKKNHFIFYVETTGAIPVDQIFYEGLEILKQRPAIQT